MPGDAERLTWVGYPENDREMQAIVVIENILKSLVDDRARCRVMAFVADRVDPFPPPDVWEGDPAPESEKRTR